MKLRISRQDGYKIEYLSPIGLLMHVESQLCTSGGIAVFMEYGDSAVTIVLPSVRITSTSTGVKSFIIVETDTDTILPWSSGGTIVECKTEEDLKQRDMIITKMGQHIGSCRKCRDAHDSNYSTLLMLI